MQSTIRSVRAALLFAFLFSLFSLLSAQAGALNFSVPTPRAQSPTPSPRAQMPGFTQTPRSQMPSKVPPGAPPLDLKPVTTRASARQPRRRAPASCGSTSQATLPPSALIVDDLDTGFHRYGPSGYWHDVSGSANDYYNGHMVWTSNMETQVINSARWDAPVTTGSYQVFAFIPRYYATTQSAWYTIKHNGVESTCVINQNVYYAKWVDLGTYQFGTSGDNYVMLDDYTTEPSGTKYVGFDAVAFVPVTLTSKVFLPFILNSPALSSKMKTGIHLGNRNSDWTSEMLRPFDPRVPQSPPGAWPAIIVAQSRQVFNVNRSTTPPDCKITTTSITVRNQNAYNLLRDATLYGNTKVVIRITPAPGNFLESTNDAWLDPMTRPLGRTLITETNTRPAGWYQCDNEGRFRPPADIGDEMLAIQRFAVSQGWSVWGFEPANEPNVEWYTTPRKDSNGNLLRTNPSYSQIAAWQAMDQYFANIHNYVHQNAGNTPIRVLTPPMSQSAYAEKRNVVYGPPDTTCPYMYLENTNYSGYSAMPLTFNSRDPKNDG